MGPSCLNKITINNVALGDSLSQVIEKLGQPLSQGGGSEDEIVLQFNEELVSKLVVSKEQGVVEILLGTTLKINGSHYLEEGSLIRGLRLPGEVFDTQNGDIAHEIEGHLLYISTDAGLVARISLWPIARNSLWPIG